MTTATKPTPASAPAFTAADLDAHWMGFTANRAFKQAPRLLASAKGMYYTTVDGRELLDGVAGLWCVNAGHGRESIARAIARSATELDYSPAGFQIGHPSAFELADRLTNLVPGKFDRVFFTNSGSESVDTALKIALAYWQAVGETQRVRFVGRLRGYHGVGFGGMTVGGIESNRKAFGAQLLPQVDHLPTTHGIEANRFSRGQPAEGAYLADALEEIVAKRGAETIAACIVEPVAGSAGILVPPKGYLERLRAICDKHGILLIFDEVITGFGRLGSMFGAERFGVTPDIITMAKGLSNAAVPMGAVMMRKELYDRVVNASESGIEFMHGYTYGGHPLACAAALASLDIHVGERLAARANSLAPYFEQAVHSLRDHPHVIDIRNEGLMAGIELEPRPGKPTARALDAYLDCFREGVLIRYTGDTIALSPPLIIEKGQIDRIITTLGKALERLA
ncbi:MAG TPA: aspartate aminotransferase family protein [Gemmatimonadaceae bacterium]|nr:aspartate aminotransferase family protein [Gemmatimonadaceae bacterium]